MMNDGIKRLDIISAECRSMAARIPHMLVPKRDIDRYCERSEDWEQPPVDVPEAVPAETVRRMLAAIAKIAEAEDSEALNHALLLAEEFSKVKILP